MEVVTGLAAFYRHTPASIQTGQVGREIQVGEVIPERGVVGVSAEEQGPTARTLKGPVQLSASLALSTLASVLAFTPWRMVEAELYTPMPNHPRRI